MNPSGKKGDQPSSTRRVSVPAPRRPAPRAALEESTIPELVAPPATDATILDLVEPAFDAPIAPAPSHEFDEVDDRLATIPIPRARQAEVDRSGVTSSSPDAASRGVEWEPPPQRMKIPAPRGASASAPFPVVPAATSTPPAQAAPPAPRRAPLLTFVAAAVGVGVLIGVTATLLLTR